MKIVVNHMYIDGPVQISVEAKTDEEAIALAEKIEGNPEGRSGFCYIEVVRPDDPEWRYTNWDAGYERHTIF